MTTCAAHSTVPLGAIQGHRDVFDRVRDFAREQGRRMYEAAERQEFSGDPVETERIPEWLRLTQSTQLPDLDALGLERTGAQDLLVITAGVDPHTDGDGLVLMLTLHNDGLTFRQGRVAHVPTPGDWFLFDDRKAHGMREPKGPGTFVGWHIAVRPKG